MNDKECISEKKPVLFEEAISRLQKLTSINSELIYRAKEKSGRIANTMTEINEPKTPQPDCIIGYLHSICDDLDRSNARLEGVVSDLENSIP